MSEYIFSIHEIVEHIFENLDLQSKLHFISCNKFLRYTYSHLIRIDDTRLLDDNDIKRKFFNNCTSCKLSSKLEKYPRCLKRVFLTYRFDGSINDIPDYITHLTFGNRFNQPINDLEKLIYLTHLTFDHGFNQPIKNLPGTITHLTFKGYFNQPINTLPDTITHLTFGDYFDQQINYLPGTITHLTFGWDFNQPINNLPCNITHLTFGNHFNQPINDLPDTITHLTFEWNFK